MAFVGAEVTTSPAARTVRVERLDLSTPARGDLQNLSTREVAAIDDQRDAQIAFEQLPELRPPAGQPPEGVLLPEVSERPHGRASAPDRRDPCHERLAEEGVEVEALLNLLLAAARGGVPSFDARHADMVSASHLVGRPPTDS